MKTISPTALDEILQKYYLEVRKQDGTEYEPHSLKVMQAALERYLCDKKYPYSLITGREFASSRAVLDAKVKQLRMNGYGPETTSRPAVQLCKRRAFLEQWLVRRPQWSTPNECKL